jgi:hypothetical protein
VEVRISDILLITSEDGDMNTMNQSQINDIEMVQGQSNGVKNDGNNEEEEGDDE